MTAALPDLSFHPAWHAQLELAYARAGDATRPVTRRHAGPLRVQKHLYAEGPEVCQHILVHPPGGIAGNFGTGWTEASDLRENALWFGGKLSRVLDDVHIREPRDPLAEWRLDSACGRVELLFRPEQLHQARPSVGLFYANTRQWFGRFNGTLRHDDGDCVPVDGALGWIGSTRARW